MMDASWLTQEFVFDATWSPFCGIFSLNNTIPMYLFLSMALVRAGRYHGLSMPVLRFLVIVSAVFTCSQDMFSAFSKDEFCGSLTFTVFEKMLIFNSYEPDFADMFSSMKGLLAFVMASLNGVSFTVSLIVCLCMDMVSKNKSVRFKKMTSCLWLVMPYVVSFAEFWFFYRETDWLLFWNWD